MPNPFDANLNQGGIVDKMRFRAAGALMLAVSLALGLAACSGPPPGGGQPSKASIDHAVHAVIDGLKSNNETIFFGAVQSAKTASKLAWKRCEPAMHKGAKVTSPGQDDPTVASVVVEVAGDKSAGCDIALYWSWDKHWSMKSWTGSQSTN